MTRLYITLFCAMAMGFAGALTGRWWLMTAGIMLTPIVYLPWGRARSR
jgi:hypothetical protein